MNGARFVILASSRLLASQDRLIMQEAWLADLDHCERAGITPWQIAAGAALTAASPHNLRARLTSAPDPRRKPMNEYRKGQVRAGLWWAWTFGAVVLLFAGMQSFPTPSGSGSAVGSPGAGYVSLGPVMVGIAIAATALGIIAIILEHRRLATALRTSPTSK